MVLSISLLYCEGVGSIPATDFCEVLLVVRKPVFQIGNMDATSIPRTIEPSSSWTRKFGLDPKNVGSNPTGSLGGWV